MFTNDSSILFTNDQPIIYQRLQPIVYQRLRPIVYQRPAYCLPTTPADCLPYVNMAYCLQAGTIYTTYGFAPPWKKSCGRPCLTMMTMAVMRKVMMMMVVMMVIMTTIMVTIMVGMMIRVMMIITIIINSSLGMIHCINWLAKRLFSFSQACSLLSGSLALEALLIGVHYKKRYINVLIQYNTI